MSGPDPVEPVLVEGLDQVLLIRLYPEAEALSAAGDMALAQGVETAAAGAELEASQYEDILGTEEGGGGDVAPTAPPVNVDVPHVQQVGSELTCTMGNWEGMQAEPHSYAYQWQLDGADITVGGTATLPIMADDVGKTATCVVSATNALGTTAAPPSNGVVVTAP